MLRWLPVLLVAGCAADESRLLSAPGITWEHAALVPTSGGLPTRVSETFSIIDGAVDATSTRFELLESEDEVFVVGVRSASIRASLPAFDPSRVDEVRFELDPSEPEEGALASLAEVGGEVHALVLSDTEALVGGAVDGPPFDRVQLVLPADDEYCRPNDDLMIPWGVTGEYLPVAQFPTGRDARELREIRQLDSEHIVAMSKTALYLLDRNDAAPIRLGEGQIGAHDGQLSSIALDPIPRPDGRRTLWTVVERTTGSVVLEVIVDPSGFEIVGTASVAPSSRIANPIFLHISSSPDGDLMLTGGSGFAAIRMRGSSTFQPGDVISTGFGPVEQTIRQSLWLRESVWPHLFAADNGDLIRGDLSAQTFAEPSAASLNVRFNALAQEEGGVLWAAGATALILRFEEGQWKSPDLVLPRRLAACTSVLGSSDELNTDFDDLVLGPNHAYVIVQRCSAVVRIRLQDLCVSVITQDGGRARSVANDDSWTSLHMSSDGLLVGGRNGAVYWIRE